MFNSDKIKSWLGNKFFAKKEDKKSEYVCPECGSSNWKFPNPLKPAGKMINTYQLVNNLFECKDCNYVGIFYAVDNARQFQSKVKLNNKELENKQAEKPTYAGVFSWLFVVIGLISIFLAPSLYWGVITAIAFFAIAKKLRRK